MFQIVPPGTHIDFIGRWRICAVASLVLLAVGLAGAFTLGVRFGIDFAGGTEMVLLFGEDVDVDEARVRGVVEGMGIGGASVVRYGELGENEFLLRFQREEEAEGEEQGEIVDRIGDELRDGIGALDVVRVEYVGPRVGAELRRDGITALAIAGLLILIYISFRFTIRFAPGAIVALLHDVLVTSAIWVLLGQEFNLQVLAALLAIVGYSLNDTIIVYDRIRENMELRTTADLPEVLNHSVNQTLSRTILTSGTTLVAVLSLLLLGGETIRPFAMAMAIGIVVGTYSSVYIAAPTLLWLERRYGSGAGSDRSRKRPKARAATL